MISLPQNASRVKRRKDGPLVLRGEQTTTRSRVHFERSINLTFECAHALCLTMAARPDILHTDPQTAPHVERDHKATKAKHGDVRFYVRFLRDSCPLSYNLPKRKRQDLRAQRAADQRHEMEFFPCLDSPKAELTLDDKPGWHWCLHTFPNEAGKDKGRTTVYEVHPEEGCTCPDFRWRCAGEGLLCKHFLNLRVELGLPEFHEAKLQQGKALLGIAASEKPEAAKTRREGTAAWDF